MFVKIKII